MNEYLLGYIDAQNDYEYLLGKEASFRQLIPMAMLGKALMFPTALPAQIPPDTLEGLRRETIEAVEQAPIKTVREVIGRMKGIKMPSDTAQIRALGKQVAGTRLFPNMIKEINQVKPIHQGKAVGIARNILKTMKTSQPTMGMKVDLARQFMHLKGLR